jgi:hypothetical protein
MALTELSLPQLVPRAAVTARTFAAAPELAAAEAKSVAAAPVKALAIVVAVILVAVEAAKPGAAH